MKKTINKNYIPVKVENIISAFESPNADPKSIAKKYGFNNHIEMADYMKSKGYKWDISKNNYIKFIGLIEKTKVQGSSEEILDLKIREQNNINEYIPFIKFLYEKRNDIYQLLNGIKEYGKIPRYALPGIARTKAIYMNDIIARLIVDFSREKNITQREIVETALIEFLQKYGYNSEIQKLLKSN